MRLLVAANLDGRMEVLKDLSRVCAAEKPDAVVFCGDIVSGTVRRQEETQHSGARISAEQLSADLREELQKEIEQLEEFFRWHGDLQMRVFYIPGDRDAPYEHFCKAAVSGMNAMPTVRSVHGVLRNVGRNFSLVGVGGELTENRRESFWRLAVPRAEAEYLASPILDAEQEALLVVHSAPRGKMFGQDGNAVAEELIHSLHPYMAFCGQPDGRDEGGQETAAHTTIIAPGRLSAGRFAMVDVPEKSAEFRTL